MEEENSFVTFFETQTKWVQLFWKWCVPVIVLGAIAFKVFDKDWIINFEKIAFKNNTHWLLFSFCLLPINVLLDAKKWQILVDQFQKMVLYQSLKIVLAGKSLNAFVPLAIGDMYARVLNVASENRTKAVGALAMTRSTQMLPTLIFGTFAIFYMISIGIEYYSDLIFYVLGLLTILLASYFILKKNLLKNIIKSNYLMAIHDYKLIHILQITLLSFLRYIVFSLQFIAVFYWLGWDLDFYILAFGISWIFLIKSIIPDLSVIGDLAKREISAIAYFSLFGIDLDIVVISSFIVWVVNIVLPSVVGLFYLQEVKKNWT